ncbi:hypothetical protein SAMN06297229_1722 [Pseudidiomarina planktonica]|uniref:Uncharacterized protein n=1 Tax=Pseudidiomarina planktonica TaxID=1323738 RepID=A0A1Y6F2J1_9GAMM|nr:hypothetical protein [Pseudidiomarina planktonica]RUO64948.1 hypothetical protein CWI77_00170 [Pseudidiomarina planktonica]SMQ69017.1 hypothetical protein SAMN06297229_1722 [Pseudidiomarina planktonica]
MMQNLYKAVIRASVVVGAGLMMALPASAQVNVNYDLPSAEVIQERKDNRKNQAVGERVGRRIMSAFELYEADDMQGAIAELADLSPSEAFDVAYVNRFLGAFYASEDQTDKGIPLLKQSVDADVLGWSDQSAALKTLADLYLQEEDYNNALRYYDRWLQFTGDANPDVFLRIANAYYELKQYDKVIKPADMALQNFDKPNKNPYILKMASYYEREMFADAITVLEEGLNVIPTEKGWWNQLANFYMLEERIDKALETIEVAYLAGYLNSENQHRVLIQLYANNEIPYKAAMLMAKHIDAGDIEENTRNAQSAARNFEGAREFEKAAEWYGRSAALAESSAEKGDLYRRQGVALIRAEEYARAADALNQALQFDLDKEGAVHMALAEAYLYTRDYRQALDAATTAQQFDSERRSARSWAGYIRNIAERRGVSL